MTGAERPYSGLRVLDLTHWLGRYAARLYSDLGAEVTRIARPGAPSDYAATFCDAGKQVIALDPQSPDGRAGIAQLVRSARLIFVERDGPLAGELAWLRSLRSQSVICHVSPYGLGGPLQDAPANDLSLQAAGGLAWLSGRPGQAPLRLPGEQSVMIASVYAAVASALCLADLEAGGAAHLVDVSAQECIAHSLQNALQVYDLEGRISQRGGEGTRDATEDLFACEDGFVFLAAPLQLGVSWTALLGWMREAGDPAAAALEAPEWSDRVWRMTAEARSRFRPLIEAFLRATPKQEATLQALRRRIVLAQVSRVSDVLGDEQLAFRQFFVDFDHPASGRLRFPGAPYRLSAPVWAIGSPAPAS